MRIRTTFRLLSLLILFTGMIGFAVGCSQDSPSEPTQNPPSTPPGTPPAAGTYLITVSVSPTNLQAGGDDPATITVNVVRRSTGAAPTDGTNVTVSTSLGDLGTANSGVSSTLVPLSGGVGRVSLFPNANGGRALIRASLENSVGQAAIDIGEDSFFISFLQPSTGRPDGGDTVVIEGGGFEEPIRVLIDGSPAQIISATSNRIRVVTPRALADVPAGSTRAATVNVTINLNQPDQQIQSLPNGFTYVPGGGNGGTPRVFSLSPASGPNEGGTRVNIVGEGFEAPVQVFFGTGTGVNFTGVEATVESVNSSQIVAVTPSATGFGQGNQNARVNVQIRNLNSGFTTIAQGIYRYGSDVIITSVSPNVVDWNSGERVTIFGQGFDEPVAVSLAGIGANILSVTGTQILVRAPVPVIAGCQSLTGDVGVTNIETGDSNSISDAFTFLVLEPLVTGVSPASGTELGGNTVTISGSRFESPSRVFFGDSAATLISETGNSIVVRVPQFAGTLNEEPCDDDGDGQQGSRFVATSVDVRVTNLLTDCEDEFTGGYTYTPTDVSCRGDAMPPPPTTAQCNDGFDNDGDGFIDAADPECTGPDDNDEST